MCAFEGVEDFSGLGGGGSRSELLLTLWPLWLRRCVLVVGGGVALVAGLIVVGGSGLALVVGTSGLTIVARVVLVTIVVATVVVAHKTRIVLITEALKLRTSFHAHAGAANGNGAALAVAALILLWLWLCVSDDIVYVLTGIAVAMAES